MIRKALTHRRLLMITALSLGVAVALGRLWPALGGVALTWVVLRLMHRLEDWVRPPDQPPGPERP